MIFSLIVAALLPFNEPLPSIGPLQSISTTSGAREIILFDLKNSPILEEHFNQFCLGLASPLTEKELIESACAYIKNNLLDPQLCNLPSVTKAVREWQGDEEIPLDYFAEKKTAVCRHTALFGAYFLEKMKEKGLLSGTVYPIRQNIPMGMHAWCLFAGKEGMWHIDPLWAVTLEAHDPKLNKYYGEARMIPHRKKILFFDLGGVLVNFDFKKMCESLSRAVGQPAEEVEKIIIGKEFGKKFEKGEEDFYSPLIEKEFDQMFSLKKEMVDLIHHLKKEGAILWVLSNTVDAHFQYLRKKYDFLNLFDGYILSYKVGARKPEAKIYEYALEHVGATPQEVAYIDDIPEFVEAAKKKGIDSHPFTTIEQLCPVLKQWGYGCP